ncbi:hypothetical protein IJI91_01820 [Candidatus Saccharibacteria bacterium]|nr:hypothetical protein [Candidatus Saccharibacteria bacterium]
MPTLKVEDIQLYVYGHSSSFLGLIPDYPRKAFVGKSATTHKSRGSRFMIIITCQRCQNTTRGAL